MSVDGVRCEGGRSVIHVGPTAGAGAYDVVVGWGLAAEVAALVMGTGGEGVVADPAANRPGRALVVHAGAVEGLAREIAGQLRGGGVEALVVCVPDGEAAKTVSVAADLWSRMGRAGFTRSDVVVGVGGGAVTDLAGWVAASWLRGVSVVQVPTTVLGMVDAAVGGKTGINTAEGKNLVGAFHPPLGVFADLSVLRTLPKADVVAGLAEVVKGGFIADRRILELIEQDPLGAVDPESGVLRELVERKIAVKAGIVTGDLREAGEREFLNYGHTLAHAIENLEGYTWRHGDAVSVGMVFAAELACSAGLLDAAVVRRHRDVLSGLGLPVGYSGAGFADVVEVMGRDKKTRGATLRFVVLAGVGVPRRLVGP
ncbi:3-dehydroquinate synthase, partial [Dermatophilus congolensis]|nr:3-dehydroquinate synthase [Dermatophilus congolensis]